MEAFGTTLEGQAFITPIGREIYLGTSYSEDDAVLSPEDALLLGEALIRMAHEVQ